MTAFILSLLSAVLSGLTALSVAFYERRSIRHWYLALGMTVLAMESGFSCLTTHALLPGEVLYWQNWRLLAMSFLPGSWLLFSLSYARGNYREFLVKWWLPLAIAFVGPVGLAIGYRGQLIDLIVPGGLPADPILGLTTPGVILHVLFLLGTILVLMNLELTFRSAVGTMRWRIKFMILGLGVLFSVRAYTCSQNLLFRSIDLSLQTVNASALLLACLLVMRSVLRAGHRELSVYPSQTVLLNSLTVLLAGFYLVIVGTFAKVVIFFGGDAAFQIKAFFILVSLVLLASLLLSDRVRLATKRFVSRHFQRPEYDYRAVWRTFTEGTARLVEPGDLCAATVKVVSDIFRALSVTLWLVGEGKDILVFAASTSLSKAKGELIRLDPAEVAKAVAALRDAPRPIDLDLSAESWAVALRQLHPGEFREGGNRIAVPLVAGGELLGVLMLGDRVGGEPFTVQDFDLLTAASQQAASNLLNLQLFQKFSRAKQMEAFQSMSTFFVHDLKNTASTLSLMLQNLPVHFNDPNFRADALQGISKTVNHINELIGRLSSLRQDSATRTVATDLNQLVREELDRLVLAPGIDLSTVLQPLPEVWLDPAQIQSVVTNLLLNATEAVGVHGWLKVETAQREGWVVLSVADNGCGISAEFLRDSLFRPFQTTKKRGIGIGMFQCRMIVEAHRGKIEVESELGKGTVFRVLLPGTRAMA